MSSSHPPVVRLAVRKTHGGPAVLLREAARFTPPLVLLPEAARFAPLLVLLPEATRFTPLLVLLPEAARFTPPFPPAWPLPVLSCLPPCRRRYIARGGSSSSLTTLLIQTRLGPRLDVGSRCLHAPGSRSAILGSYPRDARRSPLAGWLPAYVCPPVPVCPIRIFEETFWGAACLPLSAFPIPSAPTTSREF